MHITHHRVQDYPEPATQPALRPATPVAWARQNLAFTPDPQQPLILDSAYRRVLVNCCRQWGKSSTAAVRALHHAVHNPGSETILVAPTQRQSAEFLRKIKPFSQSLTITKLQSDGANRHALQFSNHARILALPGKRDNIRGFSRVSLLIIDEAAWVPDTLYFAVCPLLAASPSASLLVMSTPNGDSGFFHQTWASNSPWQRITVQATDCPRISPSFLEEERATMTDHYFRHYSEWKIIPSGTTEQRSTESSPQPSRPGHANSATQEPEICKQPPNRPNHNPCRHESKLPANRKRRFSDGPGHGHLAHEVPLPTCNRNPSSTPPWLFAQIGEQVEARWGLAHC